MSAIAIRVENLSKKYVISHQREQGWKYIALRDVIAERLTAPWRALASRFRYSEATSNCNGEPPASVGTHLNHQLQAQTLASAHARREDFWALKDVCFQVNHGEVVGVIGRNAAGKSTLLKTLSRITEPTTGRIEIEGRVASLLEVGTGFHPELTGRENIYLNGAILGMTRAEIRAKFDDIVAFAEVESFLDTPVKRYSSGMYVRLAFAVAAHLEPEILIVDEVLAVGDAEFQRKCLGKMSEVARGGRTVLFVSHSMSAIRALCSRAVVMHQGRVDFDGKVAQAIDLYSANNIAVSGMSWLRPTSMPLPSVGFEKINISLIGQQPSLQLTCELALRCQSSFPTAHIVVDICDNSLAPIMQVLPTSREFFRGTPGLYHLCIEIDLPPLIPGFYTADFWIGPHFQSTMDCVKNVVAFEVTERPWLDLCHPHSPGHGFLVPPSRYRYSEAVTRISSAATR